MDKLVPSAAFNARIAALVAADVALLGSVDPITIALTTNEFAPSPTNVLADLTLATFTGSAPKTVVTGAQVVIRNEETGGYGVQLKEGAGGFNFVCTTAPASTQAITGYCVIQNGITLLACARLDASKAIQFIGDYVDLSAIFGFLPEQPFNVPA